MYISQIQIYNHRNYDKLFVEFSPNFNIIVGNNAQGKTNLIECIYYISRGKSHRNSNSKDLIKWNEDKSYIKGKIQKNGYSETIEVTLFNKQKKKISVNSINLDKISDLLGNAQVVLFSPEDLRIVKEGPNYRRSYIDNEIFSIKPSYYKLANRYKKILYQRNNLLKEIKYKPDLKKTLPIWNEQIVNCGKDIIRNRIYYLKKINNITRKIHYNITNSQENIELYYQSNVISKNDDYNNVEEIFINKLNENMHYDIEKGSTSIGPHLDDINIFINNIDVKVFGSQGQQRTAALSLKLAEIEIIHKETGEYPIVLLDDVMSELDLDRQRMLLPNLQKVQSFITCTDLGFLKNFDKMNKRIFTIKNGNIANIS